MIFAIVPAAGASSRMGKNKLLLPFAGTTVISHIIDVLESSSVDQIIVVTGHNPEVIQTELKTRDIQIVHNSNPDEGMLSSIRCALNCIPETSSSILVTPGDFPSIESKVIESLISSFKNNRAKIAVVFNKRKGHPLLFATAFKENILNCYDDTGLRGLLHEFKSEIHEIPVNSALIHLDIDTPEDYEKLLKTSKKH